VIARHPNDAGYPAALRDLVPAPDPLWLDGDEGVLDRPSVAIVGTRRMSPYGERVARELAAALAHAGAVVVSGLAQGIDCAAHTRPRTLAERSRDGSCSRSRSYGTRGTCTRRSIRSSTGPERRPRYRSMASGRHVHSVARSPAWPQGQGFIAAIRTNRAG